MKVTGQLRAFVTLLPGKVSLMRFQQEGYRTGLEGVEERRYLACTWNRSPIRRQSEP